MQLSLSPQTAPTGPLKGASHLGVASPVLQTRPWSHRETMKLPIICGGAQGWPLPFVSPQPNNRHKAPAPIVPAAMLRSDVLAVASIELASGGPDLQSTDHDSDPAATRNRDEQSK